MLTRCLPCSFRRWNLGLPKKLFLIFVNLVFQSWLPALLQVDAVIAGEGGHTLPPVLCGELGIGPKTVE